MPHPASLLDSLTMTNGADAVVSSGLLTRSEPRDNRMRIHATGGEGRVNPSRQPRRTLHFEQREITQAYDVGESAC